MLISTTDIIGPNARQVCDNQEKQVTRFLYTDFDKSELEYPDEFSNLTKAKPSKKPLPRPHQKNAIKDVKLRTFITQDDERDDFVAHVYDITYGTVKDNQDNLVIIDDSIVRGTTLRTSILRILDRLNPKKIIVVSSAPQIRYPDCYGIDMSKMGDFIAFQAAIDSFL